MPTLLDPLVVGDWKMPNRVVLAPLMRTRASAGRVPNAMPMSVRWADALWVVTSVEGCYF